jgi:uncharacterized protein YlxW (UPF0749 family)
MKMSEKIIKETNRAFSLVQEDTKELFDRVEQLESKLNQIEVSVIEDLRHVLRMTLICLLGSAGLVIIIYKIFNHYVG